MVLSLNLFASHYLCLMCRPAMVNNLLTALQAHCCPMTALQAHCCPMTALLTFACPSQVKTAVDDALEWLDDNQDAEEDDYREKLKEVEDTCSPIVSAAYQAGGGDDEDLEDHDEL